MEEIFYPNKLLAKDIENLKLWQIKIAALHFAKDRRDCVRFGYGYSYRPEKYNDIRPDWSVEKKNTIILVADKDSLYKKPISLRNEIDWDDIKDLLSEIGFNINEFLINHILDNIKE